MEIFRQTQLGIVVIGKRSLVIVGACELIIGSNLVLSMLKDIAQEDLLHVGEQQLNNEK
jgi:hypothetical protein